MTKKQYDEMVKKDKTKIKMEEYRGSHIALIDEIEGWGSTKGVALRRLLGEIQFKMDDLKKKHDKAHAAWLLVANALDELENPTVVISAPRKKKA
jgi:hypothetical protein